VARRCDVLRRPSGDRSCPPEAQFLQNWQNKQHADTVALSRSVIRQNATKEGASFGIAP
jgi:hypothetical protein